MFYIDDNANIQIIRGDTFSVKLFINQGTHICPSRYILKDKDEVYVGVTEPNQTFENAIIRKKYTKADLDDKGDITITFESKDTVNLIPGKYYYQIKCNLYDEEKDKYDINTIVDKHEFYIED